jgi:hypothetical protein
MTKLIDVVGQKFGRYLVIAKSNKRTKANKQMVFCKCDCGTEREVVVNNLRSGLTTSCGCWKDEKTGARMKKHGFSKNNMYYRYRAMIRRCYDPLHKEFHNYGGRGIKVCDRWLNSVENYMEDMGEAPFYMASIDRIDNDGDYFKENCHWATKKEQSINRRTTKMIEFNGESLCLADWARKLGFDKQVVQKRLKRGWTVEEAIKSPKGTIIRFQQCVE